MYQRPDRSHRKPPTPLAATQADLGTAPSAVHEKGLWLDQLPAAVLVSCGGRVRYANAQACALFLAPAPQALHEVPLRDLLSPPLGEVGPMIAHRVNGERFHAAVHTCATTLEGQEGAMHCVRDVGYERALEQRLESKHAAVQQLSGRLIEAQERERRHIARELHDEIGQCLSAIRVQFAKLLRSGPSAEARSLIESASGLTERTLGRVRSLSLLLHPPQLETLGLHAALRWHLKEEERLHGWRVHFEEDNPAARVPSDLSIAIYRIVQESLSNERRHGGARTATVRLAARHHVLRLEVTDDGRGFVPDDNCLSSRPSLGLLGMAERARVLRGELTVTSAPGRGTSICAVFPWQGAQPG